MASDGFVEVFYSNGEAISSPLSGDLVDALVESIEVGCVIAPTETVYGVIAKATLTGLGTISEAKGRSVDQLPPVLISGIDVIDGEYYFNSSIQAEKTQLLIDNFWPGLLTIVFPSREGAKLPSSNGSVAVRHSPNRYLAEVSRRVGPLYASSANITGAPTIRGAEDLSYGDGLVLLSRVGRAYCTIEPFGSLPSTILEVLADGSWICHREGAISIDAIANLLQ